MFNKISSKLILVVSLTAVLIIGIYSYLNIKNQTAVLLSEVERHANQLSEMMKNSTEDLMMRNDREKIQLLIEKIGKDPTINSIRLLNKEGEIIYSSVKSDIGMMLDKKAESCFACHAENKPLEKLPINNRTRFFSLHSDSSKILGIINPIDNKPSCYQASCHAHSEKSTVLGVLDVTISLKEVEKQILHNEIQGIIFSLIAIISIGLIIGLTIKKYVDNPVKELVKATEQIAIGNLTYKVKELGKDELGELAKAFNEMSQKIDETNRQLFQSSKMASLGQLAAGVAHEINNPLTGVLTYSSYLLKRTNDNPQLQEDLNVIVRETLRSREIVKGLLDFARQSTPKKIPIDVNEIINRAISVVSNQLKINKISLEKNLSPNLPRIIADANQIQQVIINLIVNSIDAINNNGKIKISTSALNLPPKGIIHIKKAVCNKNHNLIDTQHKIGGKNSIKLKIKTATNEGFVNLDPIYGKDRHYFGLNIKHGDVLNISCPTCDSSLIDKNSKCPICGGPVYKITIPNQGFLEGCASFKVDWQRWSYIDQIGEIKFVEIVIEDTGCGIPPENLNKIFEPFFTTKGQKGTGLGLSVIWGIVDNHNGTINVHSEVGKGTSFTIRLPENGEILS
ncbi:ATP-binding protein [Stygiobacter electus]|uniref:histidine kinase n=1 Tax=Stygiobacter electus TaxID=3032292 RepID=A0AAE3TCR5_9BACT|nr:ATP-binding protein [Stygiobacter electus]MDF1611716.1 ATP-binding protein [Stygiobacter electus]